VILGYCGEDRLLIISSLLGFRWVDIFVAAQATVLVSAALCLNFQFKLQTNEVGFNIM
jgi:hypothetical protein